MISFLEMSIYRRASKYTVTVVNLGISSGNQNPFKTQFSMKSPFLLHFPTRLAGFMIALETICLEAHRKNKLVYIFFLELFLPFKHDVQLFYMWSCQ